MAEIKRAVIHCSASEFGDVPTIDRWHKDRGWKGIGYNIVIYNGRLQARGAYDPALDGRIVEGRKLDFNTYLDGAEVGAHAMGFNAESIGICLIGDHFFTRAQFDSLYLVISLWRHIIPGLQVLGHRDLDAKKTCPNFNVEEFMALVDQSSIGLVQKWPGLPVKENA